MAKKYFEYTECNDWEGETWTVGIEIEDGHKGIQVLRDLIPFLDEYSEDEFSIKEIDKKRFDLLYAYSCDDDDEGCYFPRYMVSNYNDKFESLLVELNSIKKKADDDSMSIVQLLDRDLYKLKVFD